MNASMSQRYTPLAISLHWLLAVLMLGMVWLGFYMHGLHFSPLKLRLFNWHKWTGVCVFVLALLRLLWRATHAPPALPAAMPPLLRLAAGGLHLALYALMFAIPVSGWLMSSAKGFQTVWFGVLPLPNLVGKDAALADRLLELHEVLNLVLLGLLAAHVLAALKHHYVDRDDVLARMLPRFGGRQLGQLGALLLLLGIARPAPAVEYGGIDPAASRLEFSYTEMGVNLVGSFARYSARLRFDPAKPETASVVFDVQMASVDAGADEATSEVAGADWFDTAHHPLAHFQSTSVKRLPSGQYQLSGNLDIKGHVHAILVPVTYQAQGARGQLSGEFGFNRTDYGVGEGEWADTSVVANAIRVRFRFALTQ
jgi:cytochrome b561